MMIIGEGHGGTESNHKLFNSLVKSVSVLVVPECSKCRVLVAECSKCSGGVASGHGVTTGPLLGSPPRRH